AAPVFYTLSLHDALPICAVVFLAPNEDWESAIAAGAVIEDEASATRLMALAKRHEAECLVIDPQLIDVEIKDGAPRPTAIREARSEEHTSELQSRENLVC